jgi:hypothetical protein
VRQYGLPTCATLLGFATGKCFGTVSSVLHQLKRVYKACEAPKQKSTATETIISFPPPASNPFTIFATHHEAFPHPYRHLSWSRSSDPTCSTTRRASGATMLSKGSLLHFQRLRLLLRFLYLCMLIITSNYQLAHAN